MIERKITPCLPLFYIAFCLKKNEVFHFYSEEFWDLNFYSYLKDFVQWKVLSEV